MNKRMKGLCRKALALLLVCTLSFSMLQITAFADDGTDTPSENQTAQEIFIGQDVDDAPSADNDSQWIPGASGSEQAKEQVDSFNENHVDTEKGESTSPEVTTDSGVTPGPTTTDPVTGSTTTNETETETWTNVAPTPEAATGPEGSPIPVPQPDPDAEPTPGITITGKQDTETTTTTDSQGRETNETIDVSGTETVDQTTKETPPPVISDPKTETVADKYVTPKPDGVTITVGAPGNTAGLPSSISAPIGTVDMKELVGDKMNDAINGTTDKDGNVITPSAEQKRDDYAEEAQKALDDARVKALTDADYSLGQIPVLDEEGNPVLDENGEPRTEEGYVKIITETDEDGNVIEVGKLYAKKPVTQNTKKETETEPNGSEDNPTGFTTTTTVTTETTERTFGFRQPGDKPEYTGGTISRTDEFGNEIAGTTTGLQQNGNTFTTSEVVELKDAEGNVIGYTHTTYTTVYNEDGSENRTVTVETVQGESVTIDTTITETKVKTETTEVSTTPTTVTVTMDEVTAGNGNGELVTSGVLGKKNGTITATDENDIRTNVGGSAVKPDSNNGDYYLSGWQGLTSDFGVLHTDGGRTYIHQMELQSKDPAAAFQKYYGFCVDLDTPPESGSVYNKTPLEASGYFDSEGSVSNAQKIREIALNGYWGSDTGTGSLENFKQYVLNNTTLDDTQKEAVKDMSEGLALALTQALLWKHGGSSNGDDPLKDNPFGIYYDQTKSQWGIDGDLKGDYKFQIEENSDIKKKIDLANSIYSNLSVSGITSDDAEKGNTAVLDESSIINTSVKIKDQKVDKNGNKKYSTDVTVTIDAKQSKLNSKNLVLTLTIGDETKTFSVPTENQINNSTTVPGVGEVTVVKTADGKYNLTVSDVELASGNHVNFSLTGNQYAGANVYLVSTNGVYTDGYQHSQTLVVGEQYERKVNLGFGLDFLVDIAKAATETTTETITTTETHTERTWNTQRETATNYESYARYVSPTPTPTEEPTPAPTEEPTPAPTATPGPEEEIPDEPDTPLGPGPEEPDEPEEELPDEPDTPLGPGPEEPDEPDEPEEDLPEPDVPKAPAEPDEPLDDPDVPLADVPKTGDESMLWYAIAMLSGCGLAVLALTGKKKKEET